MKIIFLDRDGVINRYPGDTKYVTRWQEFKFLPGAKEAIKALTNAGYKIFIISNQAGVTKGIYSQDILDEITRNMLREITLFGGKVEEVFYCIHRQEDNCSCRKPKTGLIDKVISMFKSTHTGSAIYFIGDSTIDIQTGKNAGCQTILVLSGKENLGNQTNWDVHPDYTFKDLKEAADFILSNNNAHL